MTKGEKYKARKQEQQLNSLDQTKKAAEGQDHYGGQQGQAD